MIGYLDSKFDLGAGDCFEISDDEAAEQKEEEPERKRRPPRKGLLDIEGETPLPELIQSYKKALLNKRSVLKDVRNRLTEEKCETHKLPAWTVVYCSCSTAAVVFVLLAFCCCVLIVCQGTT